MADSFSKKFKDLDKILPSSNQIRYETVSAKAKETKQVLGQFISEDDTKAIYEAQWHATDRMAGWAKVQSKKLDYDESCIRDIMHNKRNTVSEGEHQQNLKNWEDNVAIQYVVYTPGSDLLSYYDKANEQRLDRDKSNIPPSLVYHIRFETDGARKTIHKLAFPYYPTDKRMKDGTPDYDTTFAARIRKTKFPFLTESKTTRHVFFTANDAADFLNAKTGYKNYNDIYLLFEQGIKVCFKWKQLRGYTFQKKLAGEKYLND